MPETLRQKHQVKGFPMKARGHGRQERNQRKILNYSYRAILISNVFGWRIESSARPEDGSDTSSRHRGYFRKNLCSVTAGAGFLVSDDNYFKPGPFGQLQRFNRPHNPAFVDCFDLFCHDRYRHHLFGITLRRRQAAGSGIVCRSASIAR